jgi:ubiquinone/menaquinone biosynthesis C-methylase UbiE
MELSEEQLKGFASQLSKPNGEHGINIANMMHVSNFGMTMSTANSLEIADNDMILELGHGGGKHIESILNLAKDLTYVGLEIAELMKQEAESQAINHTSFYLYDGQHIPFENNTFTKAMTVNTIYFWKNPNQLLKEVYRVLKKGGFFAIGFAPKEFMQTLPFTKYGFELYDEQKFQKLIKETPFKIKELTYHNEKVKSRTDEMVDRTYTVAVLHK